MNELGPGPALLLMGVMTAVLVGVGAAIGWAIVTGWRDRDRRRNR
jgi:hypothetical protein